MKPFFLTYFCLASFAVFSQQPSMGARFSALSDAAVVLRDYGHFNTTQHDWLFYRPHPLVYRSKIALV